MLLNKAGGVVAEQQIASQFQGRPVLFNVLSFQIVFEILVFFLFADKCKRFLQEFYAEDDNGKKVFKYGAQLVSVVLKW